MTTTWTASRLLSICLDAAAGKERRMDRAEKNKQTVASFYDLMFNQSRPAEAIDR